MANKRTRKAAAARKRAAALAARVVPMDIDDGDDDADGNSGDNIDNVDPEELSIQAVANIQKSIDAALFQGASVSSQHPYLERLSPEEVRLCAVLARRQALAYMGVPPPLPMCSRFNDDVCAPDVVTSAMAAARFACAAHTTVVGHARALNHAYEASENELTLTQQQDEDSLYIFHAYDDDIDLEDEDGGSFDIDIEDVDEEDDDGEMEREIEEIVAMQNEMHTGIDGNTVPSPLCPSSPVQSIRVPASLPAPVAPSIPMHPALMADARNAAEKTRSLRARNHGRIAININSDGESDDDDNDDNCHSGSSSSLWTSFGRLFNFGRSPSYETAGREIGDTGPKSPNRFPPPILNPNTGNSDEKLFVASSPVTPIPEEENDVDDIAGRTITANGNSNGNSNGNRRVLRAARSLKQDSSAASTLPPKKLTDELSPSSIAIPMPACPPASATGNTEQHDRCASRKEKRKKRTKVKRRPRVRLVEEGE